VAGVPLGQQFAVLAAIAVVMTVGVYGVVAGIVKLDDWGLYLSHRKAAWRRSLGGLILRGAPWLMKTLSVVGTAAMFLVGGGILVHGWPWLHHAVEGVSAGIGIGWLSSGISTLLGGLSGATAGALTLAIVTLGRKMLGSKPGA